MQATQMIDRDEEGFQGVGLEPVWPAAWSELQSRTSLNDTHGPKHKQIAKICSLHIIFP